MSERSGRRLWLLAFVGFFLLHAGWSFAAPYNGPPDEQRHAIRAAGVLDGQLLAPPAAPDPDKYRHGEAYQTIPSSERDSAGYQTVPQSLVRPRCFPQRVEVAADCAAEPGGDRTPVTVTTDAARYNPVYYLVTSWPLGLWPDWRGILLSRLLTGAAVAALLACALVAAARWTRHRAMVAGVVVAVTPMVAHLGGSINPSGLEIAAGVALFAALIPLVHEQSGVVNRAAVTLAGVAATALVLPRFTGVLWLAVILGVLLVPSSRARLAELARSRLVRVWSVVVLLSGLAGLGWTLFAGSARAYQSDLGLPFNMVVRVAVVDDVWPNVANQMVGVMGWAETLMPRLVYVVWFAAVGLLVLGGLTVGSRVERWRLLALLLATFTPLLTLEILTANQVGWFNQGRYFLPGAVGLPMLGALILARRRLTADQIRSMTRLLAVLLLPIHVGCLAFTMCRWQSGLRSLNPFGGSWSPPLGSVLPLACATLAVVALAVAYWHASRTAGARSPAGDWQESLPVPASTVPV
jgi:Predicted membrane protein (DUF2142)